VLTRELLAFRRVQGKLRPTFVDAKDQANLDLAAALVDTFQHAVGDTRGALDETLDAIVGETRKQKLARGLVKLLLDKSSFEEPGDASVLLRRAAFTASAAALRALPADDVPLADYLARLAPALPRPLADCREHLYDDLAEHRRLVGAVLPTPQALLERYNLALAQGLAFYASNLRVRTGTDSPLELRRLLRWLKWSRLVADIRRDGDEWALQVEGPGAMFDMQKKYGLQLATFLAAVPLLARFTVEADVAIPRGAEGTMALDHKDPLRALDRTALGHIPPEIEAGLAALGDARWTVDPLPELRHTGATGMCVPDFGLRDADSGATLVVELFHRWHSRALLRRLDELAARPDPGLALGVDLALVKDAALAARVADHPQVFTFNKFPARRRLQPLLDRLAGPLQPTPSPPARPAATPATTPAKSPAAPPPAAARAKRPRAPRRHDEGGSA
jgi:predicted nuclease of restriction endonuclease-like RecB superfamily